MNHLYLTISALLCAVQVVTGEEIAVRSDSNEDKWTSTSTYPDLDVKVGDVLVFKSDSNHDLVSVDQAAYDSCTVLFSGILVVDYGDWAGLTEQSEGLGVKKLTMSEGVFYYACRPHCSGGQKFKVTVTKKVSDCRADTFDNGNTPDCLKISVFNTVNCPATADVIEYYVDKNTAIDYQSTDYKFECIADTNALLAYQLTIAGTEFTPIAGEIRLFEDVCISLNGLNAKFEGNCPAADCNENEFSNGDGTCTACTGVLTNAAGDDSSVPSKCGCPVDQKSNGGGTCTACTGTLKNAAGDDPSVSSECDCPVDQKSNGDGTCTACTGTLKNPAGDDSSVRSECGRLNCRVNEFSNGDGTCSDCPSGKTNKAGDNATTANGAATTCVAAAATTSGAAVMQGAIVPSLLAVACAWFN